MSAARRPVQGVAGVLGGVLGDLPIAVRAYDGSEAGPSRPAAVLDFRSPLALRRIVASPGELGLARAYVAGDLDLEGDLYTVLSMRPQLVAALRRPQAWRGIAALTTSPGVLGRPPQPPPEEARPRGRVHSRRRDAAAIAHHYDVSGEFYRLFLGRTMTYSCAVWETPAVGLDAAQEAKYELISRKLELAPGMRLLDVGCGWGGMVIHAARHHGVDAVGVTLSREQADRARSRVAEAGLSDRVEIRCIDYRDVRDGPFDAISSIGMFEHVGAAHLAEYFSTMRGLLRPQGRLLNHGISRSSGSRPMRRGGFIQRYVFPDGELVEVGSAVAQIQRAGLEVRHVENLREHYALTLREWVRNIEENYDEAVRLVGEGRTRVWRLYLAGSALAFENAEIELHQTLAVRLADGTSGMPLRPGWDAQKLGLPQAHTRQNR